MIRGLFPRLFGQFREGGIIVGQFTVGTSGTVLTPTSLSHVLLSMSSGGSGVYTLTLTGGARKLVPLQMTATTATLANQRILQPTLVTTTSTNATMTMLSVNNTGTEAAAVLVDGSIVTIVLYVDK